MQRGVHRLEQFTVAMITLLACATIFAKDSHQIWSSMEIGIRGLCGLRAVKRVTMDKEPEQGSVIHPFQLMGA